MHSNGYVLLIYCETDLSIKLFNKQLRIPRGMYVYVGSSNISNPLLRVHRHFRKNKKVKWHVDIITLRCQPLSSVMVYGCGEDELYNYIVLNDKFFTATIRGFGSTDKPHHITHLFRVRENNLNLKDNGALTLLRELINSIFKLNCCKDLELLIK